MSISNSDKNLPYEIQERKVIGETPDLRVAEYFLAPGEFIPWHCHSKVTDTFYCLQGELHIETPKPGQLIRLQPGESFLIPNPKPHHVFNGGKALCRFILVQGVGPYDFLPIKDPGKL